MFRIAFTVRDRQLADTLNLLDGMVFDLEVRPIKAAKAPAPVRGRAQIGATRKSRETFPDPILEMAPIFTSAEVVAQSGRSRTFAYNSITRALAEKRVKRIGQGRYQKL